MAMFKDGVSSYTVHAQRSWKSGIGLLAGFSDAIVVSAVQWQYARAGLWWSSLRYFTYRTSSADMLSYATYRVLLIAMASVLTLVDPLEYPKRFKKLRQFVLITNGAMAISIVAKILVVYDDVSYLSDLFWFNCGSSVVFSVINTFCWYLIASIEPVVVRHPADESNKDFFNIFTETFDARLDFTQSIANSVYKGTAVAPKSSGKNGREHAGRKSMMEAAEASEYIRQHIRRKKRKLGSVRKMLGYSLSESWHLVAGIAATVIDALCDVALPYEAARIVCSILEKDTKQDFFHFLLFFGLTALVKSISVSLRTSFLSRANDRLEAKLQSMLFRCLLQEDIAFYDVKSVTSLQQRLTNDVENSSRIITGVLTTLLKNILKSAFIFIFLTLRVSWQLSFVMMIIAPILTYLTLLYTTEVNKLQNQIEQALGDTYDTASECMRKIKTIKQFGTEKYEAYDFKCKLTEIDDSKRKLSYSSGRFLGAVSFFQVGFLCAILGYGGHLVFIDAIDLKEFVIFLLMHVEMINGIEEIGAVYTDILANIMAASRVMELVDKSRKKDSELANITAIDNEVVMSRGDTIETAVTTFIDKPIRPARLFGSISFQDVHFTYSHTRDSKAALNGVSLSVKPGEIVAIVGRSGCGKTTLFRLLAKMYEPVSGSILLDDKPINQYDSAFLHQNVALVSSEIELLNRTIQDNLQYGILGASKIDLIQAAKEVNADKYVDEFHELFHTKVKQKCVSANKEHKLYLARALIRKPKVLLIDEIAMKLDYETEELFERNLLRRTDDLNNVSKENFKYKPTILIIAQKLSTIQRADRILVLDNGRIVGEGSHEKLLLTNVIYSELVRKQLAVATTYSFEERQGLNGPKYQSRQKPHSFREMAHRKISHQL